MKKIFGLAYLLCFFLPLSAQLSPSDIKTSTELIGLEFTAAEIDSMQAGVETNKQRYQSLRSYSLDNSVPPALNYLPVPLGFEFEENQSPIVWRLPDNVKIPANRAQLAFYSVAELASLLQSRKISSTELTQLYLDRLKQYGDTLHCVVTLTEELALEQARKADQELAAGLWKGPLHGIPYGVKDLLSVPGYKTTWGAGPYQDQVREETATVVQKLEKAGAVLVAKLSMGALAWGDVWYAGKTRNPWNLEMGSSGSSAGSASATAAGLVGFSIGTETLGSIVSPATRCGLSGLRPTYGRVSRAGAMALSWSMDKIGPICRSAEDCAMVFEVIRGTDGKDQTVIDAPFNYFGEIALSQLKIGYLKTYFEQKGPNYDANQSTLEALRELGADLQAVELPTDLPVRAMNIILTVEAAAAFDELTRSNEDEKLVRQIQNAWPNVFRTARLIPAVEYLNANRVRYQLLQDIHALMKEYDVVVAPSFGGSQLLVTNLTGHPCVVVPNHIGEGGGHSSISFIGNLFDEATILSVARAYQQATSFEEQHPRAFQE